MIEEKDLNTEQLPEDEMLPAELDLLPLQKETEEALKEIVTAKSVDELKAYTARFNLNMAKKNAVRVAKLQNLLDCVTDQAMARAEKSPGEFSNKELLDYMKTVQDQIMSSSKTLDEIGEKPMIQINNQKNEVHINVENPAQMTRESKERVANAVQILLQQYKNQEPVTEESASSIAENLVYNNEEEDNPDGE